MTFVSGILIYPVKSLDAQQVTHAKLLPSGALEHDRTFAMFDAGGGFVNGKRHAAVHLLRSHMDIEQQALTLRDESPRGAKPQTFDVLEDRPRLEEWLSEFFGFSVTFREQKESGFPDDTDSPGPTIISTATLQEIGSWFGLPVEQVRGRLRTNIEIGGVPPFWEDRLFGDPGELVRFRVGDVLLDGVNPCQRCVVPLRDPMTGLPDTTFVRRFTELRGRTLPIWSTRERFNHFYRVAINTRLAEDQTADTIRIGDQVDLLVAPAGQAKPVPILEKIDAPADYWSGELEIENVLAETETVKTFRLRHPKGGPLPFRFLPGQFLAIAFGEGPTSFQRCYSISSSPSHRNHCDITIKRDGAGSSSLHDHLVIGSRAAISGPMGRFTVDGEGAEDLVLIAGGVGITPLMSKLRFLFDTGWQGKVDLIYSVTSAREIIFHEELDKLERAWPHFRMHITVTSDDAQWSGHRGRLTGDWICAVVPDLSVRHIHLCGPTALTTSVQRTLRQIGVPETHIENEAFGRNASRPTPSLRLHFEVRFARSELSINVAADETILDAALGAGLSLDHGCRAGACGRCRIVLLEGEVDVDCDFVLKPEEKSKGAILACQSRPSGPLTIDL